MLLLDELSREPVHCPGCGAPLVGTERRTRADGTRFEGDLAEQVLEHAAGHEYAGTCRAARCDHCGVTYIDEYAFGHLSLACAGALVFSGDASQRAQKYMHSAVKSYAEIVGPHDLQTVKRISDVLKASGKRVPKSMVAQEKKIRSAIEESANLPRIR